MKRINAVKVDVSGMNSFNTGKVVKASELVLAFYKSDFFYERYFETNLLALRGESSSSVTKKLDQFKLYEKIMSGSEEWNNIADYEIDLKVRRYYTWRGVVGYIIPMKPEIWVNGKFFDNNSVELIANNLCHEWLHTIGCRHSGTWIKESLPYLVNDWFEEWYKHIYLTGEIITPSPVIEYKTICSRIWWTLWIKSRCYKVVK